MLLQAGGGGGGWGAWGFPLATFLGKVEPKVLPSFDSPRYSTCCVFPATQNLTNSPEYYDLTISNP